MKLKLSQIIEAREPLRRLAGEKYPAHIAYRIQRNIRALEPEARAYDKAREDLIKNKYGTRVEDINAPAGSYRVPPEKVGEFTAEIELLLAEETEADITCLDLESIHEITPFDMLALEWMFRDPSTPEIEKPPAAPRPRTRRRKYGEL